ncbi:Uma2 family endonuclease [Leptospirillum ferriphilum]|uniref:Putative restriction endonuclease domain-containing protein n=1 Tax=Leptospirillum ferriphilum TaxID=178606 RepID=A0A1V3SX24_9BACT|nr:Uma2 family endonuclease [Leptospirillum ferriphilum]OOH73616.1 hypothetical protein BOX24_03825 [Leptospirillum ferriphilum]
MLPSIVFLANNPLGEVFFAPTDVILSHDPLRAVKPDLVFVSKDRLSLIGEKNIDSAPDLLLEILSEGTEKRDLREKFALYERSGVPEYWIVDPDTDTVQVFRLSGNTYQSPAEFPRQDVLVSPNARIIAPFGVSPHKSARGSPDHLSCIALKPIKTGKGRGVWFP